MARSDSEENLNVYGSPFFKSSPITIIGVCGVAGAGKTTLSRALGKALQATTLFWDDYDAISTAPADYVAWFRSSERSLDAWHYPALENVLKDLKAEKKVDCPATQQELSPTPYIIFDAPLGYGHKATGQYIDYLIFLDTPLDVALARRLLRDATHQNTLEELRYYLSDARPLFLGTYEEVGQYDLRVDGTLSIQEQEKIVLQALLTREKSSKVSYS